MSCPYCNAGEELTKTDQRAGQRYCTKCGHILNMIVDQELEARKFADSAASMERDRTGTQINKNQAEDKAEQAAYQVCMHCKIPQDLGRRSLALYYEYRDAAEIVKTMRSRNIETVLAGCIYIQQQIELNKKFGRDVKAPCPELQRVRSVLQEFCLGKGRGKDPFESQMKDLGIYLNLDALTNVGTCITEVRKRIGNWPDAAVKCVSQARTQLLSIEEEKCREMTVFKYTCMLYALLCIYGFRKEDIKYIVRIARADKDWLIGEAQKVYDSKKLLLDQIFDYIGKQ